MGPLKYLFSGVRLLTVLSITAIVGGIVLQSDDIAETAKRFSESSQLQGYLKGSFLVSQAGDCSHETYPSWPDCETIECMSDGHYSCTKMKSSTTGGSTGGSTGGGSTWCSGSMPTSSSWCDTSSGTPTWKESTGGYTGGSGGGEYCSGTPPSNAWCDYSTSPPSWKESTGGYTGGSGGGGYCAGSPPTTTSWCDYSSGTPTWKESTGGYTGGSGGGEWEASPAVQESCRNDCVTNGHFPLSECQIYCKDGNWSGPGGSSGGGGGTSSMQRCFYPNATINGAKAGFTVWCESDYVNCHEGSPSGQSISNTGLQLGAPSQCEGGWGGSSGGGCETSPGGCGGGGTDEGTWDRTASCLSACETAPNSPECKTANPPQWCKTPVDQCKAACGQGGIEGGWTPPPTPEPKPVIDKPLDKTQCSRDPKSGALAYMNATIKGWTVVPKHDCESKGLRPGQTWSANQHPAPGEFSGDQGDMGGIGDYMGDLGGYGGHIGGDPGPEPFVDKDQLEREKKDMTRNMSQRSREVKDMRRSLKDSRSDNPAIASKIDAFEQGIQKVTGCFETATDFDAMQDCHDQNNDLNDLTQGIWSTLQAGNIGRDLDNQQRELKNMEREITRLEREGKDTSEFKNILEEIKTIQGEVKGLLESDPEEAQYRMQDVWDLQRDFWDAMQETHRDEQADNLKRFVKEGCRDFKGEAKRQQGNAAGIEKLVKECEDLLATAQKDIESGTEPREVEENLRWAMDDLWQDFNSLMEDQWSANECRDAERSLKDAERAVTSEAPDIIDEVRDSNPAIATKMETLLQKAENILREGFAALKSGSCEKANDATDKLHHDISQRFDDLMDQAGVEHDFEEDAFDRRFVNYDDAYDDFDFDEDEFGRENFTRHLSDKQYGAKDLSLMKRIAAEVLKEYFTHQEGSDAPDIISATSALGISTQEVQKLLQVKNDLVTEINALRTQIQGLKDELVAIADEVARFTFGSETAKEAEAFVKNELPYLTEEEAAERLEELKQDGREEHFDAGRLAFKDIEDITVWYADDAARAKELGLVEGTGDSGGTELNPTGNTNVAETITMFARLIEEDIDKDAVPTSDIGTELPDWAQPFAATLEDAGVDLDAIFEGSDASAPATRGEVARLLDATLDLDDADSALADRFDDIDDATDEEHDAIAAVFDAGIMTGHGNSKAFGVNGPLLRAELAAVLNRSHEEFVGAGDEMGIIIQYREETGKTSENDDEMGIIIQYREESEKPAVRVRSNIDADATVRSRNLNGGRPSRRSSPEEPIASPKAIAEITAVLVDAIAKDPRSSDLRNAKAYAEELEEHLNTLGDDAQMTNLELQSVLQKQQQLLQMLANISKIFHDEAMAIIRNIDG